MFQLCFKFVSQFCEKIGQHMADVIADITPVDTGACKNKFSHTNPIVGMNQRE
jgi:hypothetical protein